VIVYVATSRPSGLGEAPSTPPSCANVRSVFPFGEVLHYTDQRADVPASLLVDELREFLRKDGIDTAEVVRIEPTVEDAFIARMGEPESPATAPLRGTRPTNAVGQDPQRGPADEETGAR